MGTEIARNLPTDPLVVADVGDLLKEISRLCGVNGITPANKNAAVTALSDAQIAGFVRQLLINGVTLLP